MNQIRLLVTLVVTIAFVTVAQGGSGPTTPTPTPPPPSSAHDPGVRTGAAGAGGSLSGLSTDQVAFFDAGLDAFLEVDGVADGLGPRFNLDSCAGCHAAPAVGGSSPVVNPQVAVATAFGAQNVVPSFITSSGPVREARYKRKSDGSPDGGVHALFVITGRSDGAAGCNIAQENFQTQLNNHNVIFRIPTPTFGGGLIEQITDSAILANQGANASQKSALGISGHPHFAAPSGFPAGVPNRNGNDGTIARFGWKAQNKSLLLFAGEAYNVEQGISNELFPTERDETAACQFKTTPNDTTKTDAATPADVLSDIQKFAMFIRFLAPPQPSPDTPGGLASIGRGRAIFAQIGCALCHTPTLTTGNTTVAALANQPVNLFSDLLLHNMGPGLADDIAQGQAGGDEFRTAPLWGLGQRLFFLHDGRTGDLVQAIYYHRSQGNSTYPSSEASLVVNNYSALSSGQQQDLLNFLRSL
jgi:CxxC motif-containing protein (DUF1111 family)